MESTIRRLKTEYRKSNRNPVISRRQSAWEERRRALLSEETGTTFKNHAGKIRVALEDDTDKPRIIETLPRKGYRFIAVVDVLEIVPPARGAAETVPVTAPKEPPSEENFILPISVTAARVLFLLAQIPYVASYLATFYNWDNLDTALIRTFSVPVEWSRPSLQILALVGFSVRIYLIGLVGWGHTDAGPSNCLTSDHRPCRSIPSTASRCATARMSRASSSTRWGPTARTTAARSTRSTPTSPGPTWAFASGRCRAGGGRRDRSVPRRRGLPPARPGQMASGAAVCYPQMTCLPDRLRRSA